MAKRIEYQELVDLDGYRKVVGEARSDYKSFADEVARLNGEMVRSMQGVKAELEAIRKANAGTSDGKQQEQYAIRAAGLSAQLNNQRAAVTGLTQAEQQQSAVVGSLTDRLEKLVTEYANLEQGSGKNKVKAHQLAQEMVNVRGQMEKLGKMSKLTADGAREVSGQYNTLQKELAETRKELKSLDNAFDANTGKLNKNNAAALALSQRISKADTALKKMDAGMGQYGRNVGNYQNAFQNLATGGIGGAVSSLGVWGVALASVGAIAVSFGKDVLDITAKFEKYNAILAVALGSTQAGAAAFAMIQDFAVKTNFSVDELTESYIKMANRGLQPGSEALAAMADVANTTGKSFGQLVEAIVDVNNTERWNEMGIKAKTAGDKVSLTFRGVTKTVDRTEAGVLSAVEAFGKLPGVMGMTATISKTLEGQLSNLGDNFDKLKTTIGGELKEGFTNLIALASWLIDVFISVWKGLTPFREGFALVADAFVSLGKEVWSLIKTLFAMDERLGGSWAVLKAFGSVVVFVFKLVASAAIIAVLGFQMVVGGLNVLLNKAKEVANFFGAKFKIDADATFENLGKKAEETAAKLDALWKKAEAKLPTAPATPMPAKPPGSPATPGKTDDAKKKAADAAEKARKEQLSLEKAQFEERKAQLAAQYEDGLISEREYLAKKLALAKEEIAEEMKLIVGSGKEQQAERIKLNRRRIDAEREYKRELLKVNLTDSAGVTDNKLAKLGEQKEDGTISEAKYIDERRRITLEGIAERQQILRDAGKAESEEFKKLNTDKLNAEREYLKDRRKLQEEAFNRALSATKDLISGDENTVSRERDQSLLGLQRAYNMAEANIESAVTKRQMSETEGEERLHALRLRHIQDIGRITLDASERQVELIDMRIAELRAQGKTEIQIAETIKLEKEALERAEEDARNARNKRQDDSDEERRQERRRKEQEDAEIRRGIEEKRVELAGAAITAYFDISSQFREQDLANLERQKERELALVGDNEGAKANIEANYARKAAELKRKQAIADKANALFQIVLSTAQGAISAASKVVTLPLVPFIIALGAIQAAVVAARPIPEFYKGTSDAPEGPAWVGERGYELIESKKGGKSFYRMAAEKQVMYLNKHDRVLTHEETKRTLRVNTELSNEVRSAPGGSLYAAPVIVNNGLSKADLLDAFAGQTIEQTILTEDALKRYTQKNNQRTEWKNDYFSLPKKR